MKRGISSIISTLGLILMGVVIATVVFLWFSEITGNVITINGKNIALVCEDVQIQASYSDGTLYIFNIGNVDIYEISAIIYSEGKYETKNLKSIFESWPEKGLSSGDAFSGEINFDQNTEKVVIVPVLIGKTENGKNEKYTCGDKYGERII